MSLKHEPSSPAQAAPSPAAHVALLWVDNANLTRCHVVPMRRFEQPKFQLELTNAVQSMPSMYDAPFDSPVGAVRLVPDHHQHQQRKCSSTTSSEELSSSTSPAAAAAAAKLYDISSWMEGTRACFGEMTKDGEPWEQCPRSFLRRQEQRLLRELGIQATIGFELEFQLLQPSNTSGGELIPVDSTLYSEVKALQSGSSWKVLKQIVECFEKDLGIAVYQYHPESASGQFEISIGYDSNTPTSGSESKFFSLVDAVDQLVLARQTVYGIAAKHGLQATFVPKLKLNEPGCGAHIHLGLLEMLQDSGGDAGNNSAPPVKKNLFQSRTAVASSFIAGILEELPGMLMLLAPSTNSYERLKPQCWAGAYNCYGFENREAAIRLIGSNKQDVALVDHFEIKVVDAVANPYVAVGALLAAGIAGIERGVELPAPVTRDPAALDGAREQPKLLAQSLKDAIVAFQQRSEFWNSALSEEYASLLARLREAEDAFYGKLTRGEMIQQLVRRY